GQASQTIQLPQPSKGESRDTAVAAVDTPRWSRQCNNRQVRGWWHRWETCRHICPFRLALHWDQSQAARPLHRRTTPGSQRVNLRAVQLSERGNTMVEHATYIEKAE